MSRRQPQPPRQSPYVSLGFGLGYQITHYLDFKTMFLFPELNQDSRIFGLGAGVPDPHRVIR